MPTVLTHALAAGALVAVAPREAPKVKLAISMGLLAAIPDLDVIGLRAGIPYGDALGHRGFTHSILFALLAGTAAAWILFRCAGVRSRAWWQIAGLLALATASHGFLDAFTDAGLGVGFFIPLDNSRYFFLWRPLATSPLSVSAFFGGPALAILANELAWVGLPIAAALGVLWATRLSGVEARTAPSDEPDPDSVAPRQAEEVVLDPGFDAVRRQ